MKGLKFKFGVTFALLLGIGMVLINLVLTMLWQRDMIRSEIDRFRFAMAVSAGSIGGDRHSLELIIQQLAALTDAECALFYSTRIEPFLSPDACRHQARLRDLAEQAVATGEMQTVRENPGAHVISIANRYIFISMPIDTKYGNSDAIALAVSMRPLTQQLFANQKVVFLYILVNLVILTIAGLIRMVKVVIHPIERLAQLSEAYADDERLSFLTVKADNEFRRLSMSLNQMIQRIEADKNKLKTTVKSLREANRQLRETHQEMVRTEKLASVGRLAAGVAHEIGNPVSIIQGYMDLLDQADVSDTDKKDYLRRAEKELERIHGLIQNLLDFSRPGQQIPEVVSIHHLLSESVEMVNSQAKKENIEIIEQFGAEENTVFADSDQLRQVFLNCLLNAIDAVSAVPPGEKRGITIMTEMPDCNDEKEPDRRVRVRIQDNGAGIREADLSKVFDPFFTTKEPGRGTGLGLFVSHTIVENFGGRMRIGSGGKAGTEVLIELPVKVQ